MLIVFLPIKVGTPVARRTPRRSRRSELPHRAAQENGTIRQTLCNRHCGAIAGCLDSNNFHVPRIGEFVAEPLDLKHVLLRTIEIEADIEPPFAVDIRSICGTEATGGKKFIDPVKYIINVGRCELAIL